MPRADINQRQIMTPRKYDEMCDDLCAAYDFLEIWIDFNEQRLRTYDPWEYETEEMYEWLGQAKMTLGLLRDLLS